MGKIRQCENCGMKISIREMPNGKWLPFEFQSDILHNCIQTKIRYTAKKKNNGVIMTSEIDCDKTIQNPIKFSKIKEAVETQKNLVFNYSRRSSVVKGGILIIPEKLIGTSKVLGYWLPDWGQFTFNIVDMHNIQVIDRLISIEEIDDEKK